MEYEDSDQLRKLRGGGGRWMKRFTLPIALTAVVASLLFVFEGIFSTIFVIHGWRARAAHHSTLGPAAGQPVVKYDANLGWVGRPDFYDPNFFGPGLALTTDSRGYRVAGNAGPPSSQVTIRVICSGDSFTFGEGVRDDATWCADLHRLDPRLETVNLGQSGFGADQAYLRYRRDRGILRAQVHLFAFITDDFRRMELKAFAGAPKPTLRLSGGRLVADPVPHPTRGSSDANTLLAAIGDFRTVWFFQYLVAAMPKGPPDDFERGPTSEQSAVLRVMWRDLDNWSRQDRGALVLLYLPTKAHDYERDPTARAWQRWCREQAGELGISFVDLVDKFNALPITAREGMFIKSTTRDVGDAANHYDDQGNEWVAQAVVDELRTRAQLQAMQGATGR